jgi:hypothetical protein
MRTGYVLSLWIPFTIISEPYSEKQKNRKPSGFLLWLETLRNWRVEIIELLDGMNSKRF